MTSPTSAVLRKLHAVAQEARAHGFAVIIWTPKELGGVNREDVEERTIERGWDIIHTLKGS